MLSLLDAQGAVGFGDQPVAADQAVAALCKPVGPQGAAVLWGQQGHHHAGVEVDHRLACVTSAQRLGNAPSPLVCVAWWLEAGADQRPETTGPASAGASNSAGRLRQQLSQSDHLPAVQPDAGNRP